MIIVTGVLMYSEYVKKKDCFPYADEIQLEKCIEKYGVRKAYDIFKEQNRDVEFPASHDNAHVFGGALYSTVGHDGIDVCDSNFVGGCFHELIGRIIALEGTGTLDVVTEKCRTDRPGEFETNCLHSFGHGFVNSLGYNPDDLMDALMLCDIHFYNGRETNERTPGERQCYHGVFMEYNQRPLIIKGAEGLRSFDFDYPLEPCDTISERYAPSCFYRLTRLWVLNISKADIKDAYKHYFGKWCEEGASKETREWCAMGLGSAMAYRQITDKNERRELCSLAFGNNELKLACVRQIQDKEE